MSRKDNHTRKTHHYYAMPTASITHCLLLLCNANCQYHALLTAIMHCQLPVSRIAYCYHALPTASITHCLLLSCIANLPVSRIAYCNANCVLLTAMITECGGDSTVYLSAAFTLSVRHRIKGAPDTSRLVLGLVVRG